MRKVPFYLIVVSIVFMSWQAVLAAEQFTPQGWLQKGVALESQGVYEEAIQMYTKAIELDDHYADAYLKRGQAYRVAHSTEPMEALEDFNKAVALDPTNAEAYYQRGLLLAFIIYNEDARTDMKTAAGLGHEGAKQWLANTEAQPLSEMKQEAEATGGEEKGPRVDLKDYLPSKSEPMAHFDFNKANIKKSDHALLDEIALVLKDTLPDVKILVAGHTDNSGSEKYNAQLALKRAEAVKSYLVARRGINPERIAIKGYGESSPVDTNETEEGRAKNRRSQIQIAENNL